MRTESLHQTHCSDIINQTPSIVLRVVLRQQRGYLFLHIFFSVLILGTYNYHQIALFIQMEL